MVPNDVELQLSDKERNELRTSIFNRLIEPSVRDEHVKHLAQSYGVKEEGFFAKEDWILALLRVVDTAPADAVVKIAAQSRYIAGTYPRRFRLFQSNWYPFNQDLSDAQLQELFTSLRNIYRIGENGRWLNKVERGLGVAQIWMTPNGIRMMYVNTVVLGQHEDADTGITVGRIQVTKRIVLIKTTGIEVRSDKQFAKRVNKDLKAQLAKLILEKKCPEFPAEPIAVSCEKTLFPLLDSLSKDPAVSTARLLVYNGDDKKNFLGHRGAGAKKDEVQKDLRDLRKLVTMEGLRQSLSLDDEDFISLRRLLASGLQSAVVELDYRHQDGFLEENISIGVTPGSIQISGPMSEAAVNHFWGAFKHATARPDTASDGAAIGGGTDQGR